MADNPTTAGMSPLDAARVTARETLDRYRVVNVRDHNAVIEACAALHITLAQLLYALDSEVGS